MDDLGRFVWYVCLLVVQSTKDSMAESGTFDSSVLANGINALPDLIGGWRMGF